MPLAAAWSLLYLGDMRNLILPSLLAASLGACVITSDSDATLLVVNESSFVIEEIHLVDVGNPTWGPDLLRGDVLFPGEDFLIAVECDYYDALLVDETGAECEVLDIDLCLNDATWVIRNNTCSVFERKAKELGLTPEAKPETATQI